MTTTPNQSDHHNQHLQAVLEPVKPSSQYDFVEIESDPIAVGSPFAKLPGFVRACVHGLRWCVRTQWKIALVLLVLLIGAELLLRSLEPRLMGRIYTQTQTGGHPLAINAQGFRGDPVAVPKPKGTTRILALGDSVTFGTGLGHESTWPTQLQTMLTSQERPVEVINAALPALDLAQIELELRTRWAEFEPDEVVVVVTGNMVSFAYARRDRETIKAPKPKERAKTPTEPAKSIKDKAGDLYRSFALPGALTIGMEHLKFFAGLESHAIDPDFTVGVMLAHGYTQNEIDQAMVDEAWAIFGAQLGALQSTANDLGIPLTVVYSPPRFMLSGDLGDNKKRVNKDRLTINPVDRTAELCQQLGISFIDPRDALTHAQSPVYALSDYTHFEESGHRAIAELIVETITSP